MIYFSLAAYSWSGYWPSQADSQRWGRTSVYGEAQNIQDPLLEAGIYSSFKVAIMCLNRCTLSLCVIDLIRCKPKNCDKQFNTGAMKMFYGCHFGCVGRASDTPPTFQDGAPDVPA
ncbi:hypothetical protein ILYODFUR_032464 [Ilyodon furcidens]|uniref:Uncharacterized protein n=1 Tax=Ilyodon furcidens TaxID=33524 RepID=A0ABV0T3J3_9TELE